MSSQEALCAGHNVAHNDGCAEREDNVFIVGVQHAATCYFACYKVG